MDDEFLVTGPICLVADRSTAHLPLGKGMGIMVGTDGKVPFVFLFTDADLAERFIKTTDDPTRYVVKQFLEPRDFVIGLEKLAQLGHTHVNIDCPGISIAGRKRVGSLADMLRAARERLQAEED